MHLIVIASMMYNLVQRKHAQASLKLVHSKTGRNPYVSTEFYVA